MMRLLAALLALALIGEASAQSTMPGSRPRTSVNAGRLTNGTLAVPRLPNNGANPSASLGLSAVNGTATTWMTSDSAPALSQSIAPTWTGAHSWLIATTLASATGANLDDVWVQGATTTITGNTGSPITRLSKVRFGAPTLTDASAVTVSDADTVYISNSPTCSGSVTCTRTWALRVSAGNTSLQATTLNAALTYGGVTLSNAVTGTGNMVLATAPSITTSLLVGAGGAKINTDTVLGLGGPTVINAAGAQYFGFNTYYNSGFKASHTGPGFIFRGDDSAQLDIEAAASASADAAFTMNKMISITSTDVYIPQIPNVATTSAVCVTTSNGRLTYDGTLGTCTVSTLRAKDLIAPLSPKEGFDIVMAMEPWRYTMKKDLPTWQPGEQIGMVAEYAQQKEPRFVATEADGTVTGFRYEQYTAALTGAVHELNRRLSQLEARSPR